MRSRSLALLALAALPSALISQGTKRAFELKDWYRVVNLAAPTLSPDGKIVAFTVTTVNEAANKRHNEVWIAPLDGSGPRRMTSPGFESSAPRWSDGGKVLNFTSTRPGGRGSNWAVRMDEGGEAFQPAGGGGGAGGGRGAGGGAPGGRGGPAGFGGAGGGAQPADRSFTVTASADSAATGGNGAGNGRGGNAPNGRGGGGGGGGGNGRGGNAADATATNPLYANMPVLARPPATAITVPVDPARFDGRHFIDQTYKNNDTGFLPSTGRGGGGGGGGRGGRGGNAAPIAPTTQLFIQRGNAPRVALTSSVYSHRAPSVSPDGKWVVFSADPKLRSDSLVRRETDSLGKLPASRVRDEADRNAADLYIMPVAGCETKTSCVPKKIDFFGSESNIEWSLDSKMFSFSGRAGPMKGTRLMIYTVDAGKAVDVMGAAWPYEPGSLEWMPDNTIRLSATTGGSNGIYKVNPVTKQVTPILAGRRIIDGLQVDSNKTRMVYISTDLTHPDEVYTANYDGTNEKKLTSFNDQLLSEVQFADAERFVYKSVDNLEIESWLMKPYGYDPAKKYPVVLYIHGGPHSAYGEGWFDEFQNLAGAGIMVLFTNPRGSSNTNNGFTNASRGDWGGKDYQDLMKAVDIIAKRPDIDSTKMGVSGGSYGGFMTAWIEGHTTRFKAAETDRMISDWTLWWGTSDAQSLTNGEFFGRPWENQAMYDTLSPIRYVKNVKTPTLLVQSEDDFRTPMPNAELWYMALKSQGVPAEFVRYPRSTHELSRSGEPWLLVDRLGRIRQWFNYWLVKGGPDPSTVTTETPGTGGGVQHR